jgi:hypothetical protein
MILNRGMKDGVDRRRQTEEGQEGQEGQEEEETDTDLVPDHTIAARRC